MVFEIGNTLTKTHGMSNTPIRYVWKNMKRRCLNPRVKQYKDYGGRGIKFENRWKKFENFFLDMGDSFKEGLTLDRIYNNWGYSKENCRWADRKTQARNTRTNVMYKGKCLAEWCEELGLKYKMVSNRLARGWTIEEAISIPTYFKGMKITEKEVFKIREEYKNKNVTQNELAKKYDLSTDSIHKIVTRKTWKNI